MSTSAGHEPLRRLSSFAEVVAALGGPASVARHCQRSKNAVCNWRKRGTFPSRLYFDMITLLHEQGAIAPRELWGFRPRSGSIELDLNSDAA